MVLTDMDREENRERKEMFRSLPKNDSILAAVSRVASLEAVSLYTISLARRTSKEASLLFVLEEGRTGQGSPAPDEEELFRDIRQYGAAEGVDIRCRIVRGRFTDEVAKRLRTMGSPILVVGEGKNRPSRLRELNRIEHDLMADKSWSRRNKPHFLVVAMRKRDPAGAAGDGS